MNIKNFFFTTVFIVAAVITSNAQPTDANSILKRGNALVAQEKYKLAIEEYNKVSNRDSDLYARATYNIGVCYYELWQTDDAIAFYKRAIDLKHGKYPRASHALGVALEDQEKFTEARAAYEQAVSVSHGDFVRATFSLGLLEAKTGDFKKAAALFRETAARDGAHVPSSHNNLGVMLVHLGFLKEAEQEFVVALQQAEGRFDEAAHNLSLCRSLTSGLRQDYKLSVLN